MVTPEFKANLLERVDIVSLISTHVELKPRGSNFLVCVLFIKRRQRRSVLTRRDNFTIALDAELKAMLYNF